MNLQEGVKTVLADQLQEEGIAAEGHPLLDDAVAALVATGMGLAIDQTLGLVGIDQSSSVMKHTIEMWRDRLSSN